MDLTSGLRRLALLLATLGVCAFTFSGASDAVAKEKPACSNGVDDDGDGAVDGTDAGCGDGDDDDETDSPYSGISQILTIALPLVSLQGTVDADGAVDVTRLLVRAAPGSRVDATCKGAGCPVKHVNRVMLTSTLRLNEYQRLLKPNITLTLKIAKLNQLGKYVRYKIRRNRPPVREDSCLEQKTGKVRPCFAG